MDHAEGITRTAARPGRRRWRKSASGGLALCFCLVVACQNEQRSDAKQNADKNGPSAPTSIEVTAIDGTRHRPVAAPDGRPTVLFFLLTDCPIANAYAPEITSIRRDFQDAAHFLLVQVDHELTPEAAARHAEEYGLSGPVVIDRAHRLVRLAEATMTPEAAVFHRGTLVYRGRIDNWYVALGRKRPRATEHDLRDALTAVTAGREVSIPRTEAVGCFIPDLPN